MLLFLQVWLIRSLCFLCDYFLILLLFLQFLCYFRLCLVDLLCDVLHHVRNAIILQIVRHAECLCEFDYIIALVDLQYTCFALADLQFNHSEKGFATVTTVAIIVVAVGIAA